MGSDQVNYLLINSLVAHLVLFLALEPRFYQQKRASKNGVSIDLSDFSVHFEYRQ